MKNYINNSNSNNNNNSGDNHSQDGGEKKKVFRGPFPSNVANTPIVNAITGVKYPWKVGSYGETFLWKVVNCTHFDPKLYFYDSPEQYEAYKNVQIDSEARRGADRAITPGRQLFRGWMFASTPGLNPFQHPVYDAWLIACKTSAPAA